MKTSFILFRPEAQLVENQLNFAQVIKTVPIFVRWQPWLSFSLT